MTPYAEAGSLNISSYWCCLNPAERNVLTALSVYVLAMPPFISDETYSLLWASQGIDATLERVAAFNAVYHLEPGVLVLPDESEVQGQYLTGDFWPVLFEWIATGHAACSSPCGLLTFPL